MIDARPPHSPPVDRRASSRPPAGEPTLRRLASRLRWGAAETAGWTGRQRGARLGRAGEFEEFRPWREGEELRSLDLSVYRRLRRRVARVDREDTALPLTLILDRSASMGIAPRDRCVRELALFALLLARAHDEPCAVHLLTASGTRTILDAGLPALDAALATPPPGGSVDLANALARLPAPRHGPGRVLLISDGFGLSEPAELTPLLRFGRPIWLAPWTDEELAPPATGRARLVSAEDEPAWTGVIDPDTVATYTAHHRAWWRRLAASLERAGGSAHRCRAEGGALEAIPRAAGPGGWLRR